MREEQERAEEGPEAVGAVANGFAKSEIFPESEEGEDGDGDGNSPGRGEEDDGDGDGHEDECGENAGPSHRGRSPFRLPANKWIVIAGRIEIIQRGYQISVIGYRKAERSSPLRGQRVRRYPERCEADACLDDRVERTQRTDLASGRPQKTAPTRARRRSGERQDTKAKERSPVARSLG